MRPALIALLLLCVLAATGASTAAPLNRGPGAAQNQPSRSNAAPSEDGDDDETRPVVNRGSPQPPVRAGERRRRSYASCNRESHRQNLRGGARRRFLIRCKLGFERRRTATPRSGEPASAGKRP